MSHWTKKVLAFSSIYVVWGSTYIAIKFGVESIPPFFLMGVRSFIAGIILVLWAILNNEAELHREHWRSITIIGCLFFLIGHGFLAWGQRTVPSGLASLLFASEPIWIVVIERWWVGDSQLRWFGYLGMALGFAGVVILITSAGNLGDAPAEFSGALAILTGTLSWSCGAVYSRVASLPKSPLLTAGLELITGGSFLMMLAAATGEFRTIADHEITEGALFGLGYLIIFGSVVTFRAYVWLLSVMSATKVSTHTFVNPFVAVVLGWLIAGEPVTTLVLVSMSLITVSVYLVLKDQTRPADLPSGDQSDP
jgi:drug/metabolite transporter (DMT)-like permease